MKTFGYFAADQQLKQKFSGVSLTCDESSGLVLILGAGKVSAVICLAPGEYVVEVVSV
jgi:hypothetical protein